MSKALDQAIDALDRDRTGRVTFNEFQEFVNSSDLEEAMALITGVTGPRDVAGAVDASKLVMTLFLEYCSFLFFTFPFPLLCLFSFFVLLLLYLLSFFFFFFLRLTLLQFKQAIRSVLFLVTLSIETTSRASTNRKKKTTTSSFFKFPYFLCNKVTL